MLLFGSNNYYCTYQVIKKDIKLKIYYFFYLLISYYNLKFVFGFFVHCLSLVSELNELQTN